MDSEKGFLLGVIAILLVAFWLMLKPFLTYILFAIIIAFSLHPLQQKISSRINSTVSAFLLMVFVVVAAIVPVGFAAAAIVSDAQDIVSDINTTEIDTRGMEDYVKQKTGQEIDVESSLDSAVRDFTSTTFGSFSQVFNLLTEVSIGITLMLFLVFYFLRDGKAMAGRTKELVPLGPEVTAKLYENINKTTWAVIRGHVLVALIQGIVGGIGLFLVGIPNFLFWTFVMILFGFVPLIGSVIVWGPASLYLFMTGEPFRGTVLALYGLVIVSLTDNVVRPLVVDQKAELHPAVIIIGVIGGLYLFGAAGLFFGPIILGILKAVLRAYNQHQID